MPWDISAQQPLWSAINDRMLAALKPLNWVRPVNTFYLAPVTGLPQRSLVLAQLQRVARAQSVPVKVIVSPVLPRGMYAGVLAQATWPLVHARV